MKRRICAGIGVAMLSAVSVSAMASTVGKVFVAGDGSDNIVVIDAHTNTVVATISTGAASAPHNLVASPDRRYVWATLKDAGQVAKIDTLTNSLVATYGTGGYAPTHLAVSGDGQWLYVVNNTSDQVVKMSTTDGSIAASYDFGGGPSQAYGPHDVDVSPDGSQVWVVDEARNVVSVLDANLGAVQTDIAVGSRPIQATFSIDGSTAYVTNYDDNTVSVIDVATLAATGAFDMGGGGGMGPMGLVADPDGSTLWLSGTAGNTVHGHDLTTGGVSYAAIDGLIGAHGLDISADGRYLYTSIFYDATSTSRDAVAVIDADTATEVTRFRTTGAYNLHGLTYVAPVPVPGAVWLFGSGLAGLVGLARRRRG